MTLLILILFFLSFLRGIVKGETKKLGKAKKTLDNIFQLCNGEDMNEKLIETKEVEPEVIVQKCPTCNGHGTVGYDRKICHGCHGKGYVYVPVKAKDLKELLK